MRAKLGAASRTQALAIALRTAYEELAEREERLRTFVEAMPVAFFAFDDNLTVLASNEEGRKLTGFATEEIAGTRLVYRHVIPEEVRRTHTVREWFHRGGEFRGWEVPIVRQDGSRRIVSWSSTAREHPVPGWRTWAIGVDVTPYRELESLLRYLVDSVDQGVWLLYPDFRTHLVNNRMAEILGTDAASLQGANAFDFIEEANQAKSRALLEEGGAEGHCCRFLRSDGTVTSVVSSVRPVHDSAGGLTGYLVLVREATLV
ncbi:multi-sensor Hybrid Histidine Kinase [Fimbriimonas ginsengisoli Gsoil 348]|uniref:Multi-sensor Hybrid Histidine Kinase n=2 Tax=Fimbriimonas ginsengisoli TaxID=1005039 RepID=A0A068NY96_FIMGI|nr:multi-sensor Hybrid Histidine Kinase [Fimbriimonas ginsengisoli Gsoil 348]